MAGHPLNVEYWPIDKPQPHPKNARTHSAEQVAQIAESVRQFGFVNPILVDRAGTIIAGHGRLAGAKAAGLLAVPVIVLPELSEAQVTALRLADNRIAANAGWDDALLRAELGELKALDFDLAKLGFGEQEVIFYTSEGGDNGPAANWGGMPTFNQPDKTAFRSLLVHFADQAAVDAFASLVAQTITDKTRFIWHPTAEIETYVDKRYAAAGSSEPKK